MLGHLAGEPSCPWRACSESRLRGSRHANLAKSGFCTPCTASADPISDKRRELKSVTAARGSDQPAATGAGAG